jgi:hypothetical protein
MSVMIPSHLLTKRTLLVFFGLLAIILFTAELTAQELTKEEKKANRKARKQEKIKSGKLLVTPLAGPAYTPELGFTIAGGIMTSFKTNRSDSLIQRSSAPIMLGVSSTGAYFLQSKWTTFWLKDKMRIYSDFNFKDMPDNYWGIGYEAARNSYKSDTTTKYKRTWFQFNPKILWQFQKNWFLGPTLNINYTKGENACPVVAEDPTYAKYNGRPFNSGLGAVFQYDSRDVPVNAWGGAFVELSATFFGSYLGGQNAYQVYDFDIRKYFQISRPGKTLAVQLRGRFGYNDIPYGEMSQLGTPFDLRGYNWGRYRDNSMFFAITEYRHMFLRKNGDISPHGAVLWIGCGTIGTTAKDFTGWLPNLGFGYRLTVQPRMNLRLDYGFGTASSGFYFNFNESF